MRRFYLIFPLCLATPARAETPRDPPNTRDEIERLGDGFGLLGGMVVGALGGVLAGGVGGILVGGATGNEAVAWVGPGVGAFLGMLSGPALYDWMSDGDGSLIGAYTGLVAGGLLVEHVLDDANFNTPALLTGALLPMMVGYAAFDPLDAPIAPTVGAMHDERGQHGYSLRLHGSF